MSAETSREAVERMARYYVKEGRHLETAEAVGDGFTTLYARSCRQVAATLRALLSERDAATARAEAAEARRDLFDTQAAAAKVTAANAEAQRDAATAERDKMKAALEKAAIAAEVESAGHAIAIIEAALTSAKEAGE